MEKPVEIKLSFKLDHYSLMYGEDALLMYPKKDCQIENGNLIIDQKIKESLKSRIYNDKKVKEGLSPKLDGNLDSIVGKKSPLLADNKINLENLI